MLTEVQPALNINDVVPHVLRALSTLKFKIGVEHSKFTELFLKQNSSDDLLDLFGDSGRFEQELTLAEYLKQNTLEFAAGRRIPLETEKIKNKNISDVRVFINKQGNHSALHFDWTFDQNLLVNLFGKKEVLLWSPEYSQQFGGYANFSSLDSALWPAPQIRLSLGEKDQVVIPPFWWHQVLSHTDSCSLSIRWGKEKLENRLLKTLYPTWKFISLKGSDQRRLLREFFEVTFNENLNEDHLFETFEKALEKTMSIQKFDHPYYKRWSLGYLKYMRGR